MKLHSNLERTHMNKVKVLFLAANPKGTTQLQLSEEIRSITQKIQAAEYRDRLELISCWAVRPDDLLQALNLYKPQVVHFSGHGCSTGEIILVNDDRTPKAVNTKAIKALFTTLKDNIRVVILNACYSQIQAEAITEVIDCAIGMTAAIDDTAAITFAASFYRGIAFGRSIQESFEQGKAALLLDGIHTDTIPDLLSRRGSDPSKIFLLENPIIPNQKDETPFSIEETKFEEILQAIRKLTNPPSTAVFQAPANIPYFTGRESLSKKIVYMFKTNPTKQIIIHGMAGVGKTALAIHLAHYLKPDFTNGVLWANTTASNTTEILNAFSTAVGLDITHIQDVDSKANAFRGIIGKGNYLLVLDDVKQDTMLEYLIPNSPSTGLIITTRHSDLENYLPPQLKYAHKIELETLSFFDALEMIKKLLPYESLKEVDKISINKIVQQLSGLPLAIEIAAAKLVVGNELSPAKYLDELITTPTTALNQHIAARNGGVFKSLDLTWKYLDSEEQDIISTLGVFDSNHFDLPAIVYLSEVAEDRVIHVMDRAVSLHLITEIDTFEYQAHPLVTEYLKTKIRDKKKKHERMMTYFFQVAQNAYDLLITYNLLEALSIFDNNISNIRYAMELALQTESAAAKQTTLGITLSANQYLRIRGHWEESIRWNEAALEISQKYPDDTQQSIFLNNLGFAHSKTGNLLKALEYHDHAQKIDASKVNENAYSLFYIGRIYRKLGDYEHALNALRESLSFHRAANNDSQIANCLLNIGVIWRRKREFDLALQHFYAALEIYQKEEDKRGQAYCYGNIGNTLRRQGMHDEALENHLHALNLRKELEDKQGQADSLGNIATTYRDIKNFEKALEYYYESLSIRRSYSLKWETANSYRGIGLTYLELARDAFEKRAEILREAGSIQPLERIKKIIDTINDAILEYSRHRNNQEVSDNKEET